ILGGEAIVDRDDNCANPVRKPSTARVVRVEVAQHETTAVQIHDERSPKSRHIRFERAVDAHRYLAAAVQPWYGAVLHPRDRNVPAWLAARPQAFPHLLGVGAAVAHRRERRRHTLCYFMFGSLDGSVRHLSAPCSSWLRSSLPVALRGSSSRNST